MTKPSQKPIRRESLDDIFRKGRYVYYQDLEPFSKAELREALKRPGLSEGRIRIVKWWLMTEEERQQDYDRRNPPIADDEYSSSAGYGGWGHDP